VAVSDPANQDQGDGPVDDDAQQYSQSQPLHRVSLLLMNGFYGNRRALNIGENLIFAGEKLKFA
jgi:hypothetical protein